MTVANVKSRHKQPTASQLQVMTDAYLLVEMMILIVIINESTKSANKSNIQIDENKVVTRKGHY